MGWDCFSNWIEHHPGLASWVQAIGAIAAIGIAIWVPYAQRSKELARAAKAATELELARTEQLLTLCKELRYVVSMLPDEYMGADYRLTNTMSRQVIADQIDRLNHHQKQDESSERLQLMLKLRIELYDWLKFFSENKDHEGGALYKRSERAEPRLAMLQAGIENLKRKLAGEPELELAKPEREPDTDIPF